MAEPQEPAATPTDPAPESPTVAPETQETPLTLDTVKALIDETWADRERAIKGELDSAYKTLRRGEAKSDVAHQKIARLEQELMEVSLRGLDPQQAEIETLKRKQRDTETRQPDPNAEAAAFQGWSSSFLDEEKIDPKDPVLVKEFERHAIGWAVAADLKVALTRAVAAVHREREKTARAESADREKRAREEERARARNEKRQEEGKVVVGTPASSAGPRPKNLLSMTPEEWEAFKAQRGR